MTNPNFEDDDDKPLDPVMEKVRRKMVRLQLVSAATIVVSLMAVLGAVVYKASRTGTDSAPVAADLALPANASLNLVAKLPAGTIVTGTSLSGNRILFDARDAGGKPVLHVFDMALGRLIATVAVDTQ